MRESLRQICCRLFQYDRESAADLPQTLWHEYSYPVVKKFSAADLPHTLSVWQRVCGRSAADSLSWIFIPIGKKISLLHTAVAALPQTCRCLAAYSFRPVTHRKILGLPQTPAAYLSLVCGRPATGFHMQIRSCRRPAAYSFLWIFNFYYLATYLPHTLSAWLKKTAAYPLSWIFICYFFVADLLHTLSAW